MLQSYLNELVENVGGWSLNNFGVQPAHRPLLGIVEELCELDDALDSWDRNGVLDAVGDTVIYMSDYYFRRVAGGGNSTEWNLGVAWGDAASSELANLSILSFIRNLSHGHLKGEQNIRGGTSEHDRKLRDNFSGILCRLDQICDMLDADFQDVVDGTWQKVSKRNWKLNPNTAHEVADKIGITDSVSVCTIPAEIGDVLG